MEEREITYKRKEFYGKKEGDLEKIEPEIETPLELRKKKSIKKKKEDETTWVGKI